MPRYALTVSYEGTNFCGWQKQFPHANASLPAPHLRMTDAQDEPGTSETPVPPHEEQERDGRIELRTVQSVLERAVRHVVRQPVIVQGASRTDAGVHARGQVACFSTQDDAASKGVGGWPLERGTEPLVRAINSRLPEDVLVTAARVVDGGFNPIGATSKGYTYALWVSRDRPLWNRRWVHHVWNELDIERMHAAAKLLEGEHDFAGFAAAGHGRLTTVRTIFSCDVRQTPIVRPGVVLPEHECELPAAKQVVISVTGSGFLWNMVRIIAGTLVDVGLGRKTDVDVLEVLRSGDRTKAGPTMPPTGLCLQWIRYDGASHGADDETEAS